MKNCIKIKKTISFLLVFLILVIGVSCNRKILPSTPTPNTEYIVKTFSNMQKIKKYDTLNGGTNYAEISAAGGESESFQVIISANIDISSYYISVSDIVSGQNTIISDNIEIFNQKYIEVKNPTSIYEKGWYPDALLPIDTAISYQENKVSAGTNQGIVFVVNIPSETPKGTYTGEIILSIDNKNTIIPLSVRVYGFSLPKEKHCKTAFNLWSYMLTNNPSWQNPSADLHDKVTDELVENYYNDFLKYNISCTNLPNSTSNISSFVSIAKKYAQRSDVACYSLPATLISSAATEYVHFQHQTLNKEHFKNLLIALVQASTNDIDLLKNTYIYIIDEPTTSEYCIVKEINDYFNEVKYEVLAMDLYDGKENVKTSVENIENIVTCKITDELDGAVDTFCSTTEYLSGNEYLYKCEKEREKGNGTWMYTAVKPKAPMPSYHLDATYLENRITGFEQYMSGMEGNLYWSSTVFWKYNNSTNSYGIRDVWNDPLAFPGANGDGYLVYPGAKYNLDTFIPSVRLNAVRDGNEDYEYLFILDNLLNKFNLEYGTNYNTKNYIYNIYSELQQNLIPLVNENGFSNIREEIANLIESLLDGVLIDCGNPMENGKTPITVLSKNASTINIDGVTITSTNGIFNGFHQSSYGNSVIVSVNGNNYKKYVSNNYITINGFNSTENIESIKSSSKTEFIYSLNTSSQYISDGSGSLKVIYSSSINAEATQLFYLRLSSLPISDFTNVSSIEFDTYNDTNKPILIRLKLRTTNKAQTITDYIIKPNSTTHLKFKLKKYNDFDLSSINAIDFSFDNTNGETYTMYFDNLIVTYK